MHTNVSIFNQLHFVSPVVGAGVGFLRMAFFRSSMVYFPVAIPAMISAISLVVSQHLHFTFVSSSSCALYLFVRQTKNLHHLMFDTKIRNTKLITWSKSHHLCHFNHSTTTADTSMTMHNDIHMIKLRLLQQ